MNKIYLIGNLTKDPKLFQTSNGTHYSKFQIAVNRKFGDKNGDKITDFFNIKAWKAIAENLVKYTAKGSKIAVVGELQNQTYETPNGEKKYFTEIVANEIEFLNTKPKAEEEPTKLEPIDDDMKDSLPF